MQFLFQKEPYIFLKHWREFSAKGGFCVRYGQMTAEMIRFAGEKARNFGHSYVGSIHLLLALLEARGAAGTLLRSQGMDPALTQRLVSLLWGEGTAQMPLPQGLTGRGTCTSARIGAGSPFARQSGDQSHSSSACADAQWRGSDGADDPERRAV